MIIKRTTVAQFERVLVWKRGRFAGVLAPGTHWIVTTLDEISLQTYDLNVPEFEHPRLDQLLRQEREAMEQHFHIIELGEQEVGLVYRNGALAGVLAPGKRQLYWRESLDIRVERIDVSVDRHELDDMLYARAELDREIEIVARRRLQAPVA